METNVAELEEYDEVVKKIVANFEQLKTIVNS